MDEREGEEGAASVDTEEAGMNSSISSSSRSSYRSNRLSNLSAVGERQSSVASSTKEQIRLSKASAAEHVSQLDEEDHGLLIEKANIENQANITSAASSTHAPEVEMPTPTSSSLTVISPLQQT